jgi:hypothetical protein
VLDLWRRGVVDIWHSPYTFIGKGYGDVADHALLLCSLLLGFGLNAFVVVGTKRDQDNPEHHVPHVWVGWRGHCLFSLAL